MRVSISGSIRSLAQLAVEALDFIDHLALGRLADAVRAADVVDGAALALELHALELAGQETGAPLAGGDRLVAAAAAGNHDDVAGQVLRFRAESVEQPRAHAGAALEDRAGVHERVRRIVVDLLGDHRADDADIIGDGADVRKELGDLDAADSPHFLNFVNEPRAISLLPWSWASCWPAVKDSGNGWPLSASSCGLGSNDLEVRRSAGHAEVDDAFRPCGEMQPPWLWRNGMAGSREPAPRSSRERHAADAREAPLQEGPAAEVLLVALELVDESGVSWLSSG